MVLVLAAVVEDQIQVFGGQPGVRQGALGGPHRHRRDGVVRPGNVHLLDTHFIAHDELWQTRSCGDVRACQHLLRDIEANAGNADGGECGRSHVRIRKG